VSRSALIAFAICVAPLSVNACSSCEDRSVPADASPPPELGPVPAPSGLAAELFVPNADATWKSLRELVPGPALLLPASFPLLVTTLLGIGADASGSINEKGSLVGALVQAGDGASLDAVLAVHVKNGRSLVAALTTGQSGRFTAERDAKSGVLQLVPKASKESLDLALGVVGDRLLVAGSRAALLAGGPYVARTLPKRPAPAEPVVVVARRDMLRGPIARSLERAWRKQEQDLVARARDDRAAYGGRAPDFGDPQAIVDGLSATVASAMGLLESLAEARLVLVPLGDRLDARLEARAEPGGAMSQLLAKSARGDLAPLLRLPAASLLGVLARSSALSREESGRSMASGIARIFGERLSEPERAKLEAALLALARGRGDETTLGITQRGLVLRAAVADRAELERGIRGALDIPGFSAVKKPIESLLGPLTVTRGTARVEGVAGPAGRASFRVRPRGVPSTRPLELFWAFDADKVFVALGFDAKAALDELVEAEAAGASLAGDVRLRSAAERSGGGAGFGVLIDPALLPGPRGPQPGTGYVLLSGSGAGDRAILRAEISKDALAAIADAAM
jgi:hypothetical protein